jgi:hypothetical protein
MSSKLWSVVLFAALVLPLSGAKKADTEDEEEIETTWEHPYLPDRFFDYKHKQWRGIDTSDLNGFFTTSNTTYELTETGETLYTWEVELEIRKPEQFSAVLWLDWLSAHLNAEIVEFEATYKHKFGTETLDRTRLVDGTFDTGSKYVNEDTSVGLMLPLDRPGTLSFKITKRMDPHPGLETYFGGSVLVQRKWFIGSRDIAFVVPEGQSLRFESRFFGQKPLDVTADGKRTYTFRFRNLWAPKWERGQPHSRDSLPSIFWSNQKNWVEAGKLLSDLWEPELGASPAMQELAEATVEGLETTVDRAVAIHDLVADGWSYLGFYPGESGWVPHKAEVCYDSKVGDCKDQTALMIAMMRSVGLSAYPVIVNGGQKVTPSKVPAWVANHAVVWVEDADQKAGGFLLDSTDTGTAAYPPRDWITGRKVWVLHPEKSRFVKISTPGATHRLREDATSITLAADGTATIHVVERWHGGAANGRMAARRSQPPTWWERRQRERLIKAFPGATIISLTEGEDVDDDNAYVLEAHLTSSGLMQTVGERAVLALPWLNGYSDNMPVDTWRYHPRVQRGYEHRHSLRVELPDGVELLSFPNADGEVRDDWGWSLKSEVVDRALHVDLAVSSKPGRVGSRLEEVRRNFFAGLTEVQRRPVVFLLPEAK